MIATAKHPETQTGAGDGELRIDAPTAGDHIGCQFRIDTSVMPCALPVAFRIRTETSKPYDCCFAHLPQMCLDLSSDRYEVDCLIAAEEREAREKFERLYETELPSTGPELS